MAAEMRARDGHRLIRYVIDVESTRWMIGVRPTIGAFVLGVRPTRAVLGTAARLDTLA